uniref:Uncharacterized protein MANES_06G075700 n=1 Tax=Rhizophora mucronata TaxID=61149 RepID=A0A2P2NKY0_RHIMU
MHDWKIRTILTLAQPCCQLELKGLFHFPSTTALAR